MASRICQLLCADVLDVTLDSLKLGPKVKVIKWAPQNDILGHPAVKVFLTQAGVNSLHEAAYHAVPVVTLPMFGDQLNNAVLVGLPSPVRS